jgi:hypothetical protein
MNAKLMYYTAEKVMDDFRAGRVNPEVLSIVSKGEFAGTGYFRDLVKPEDKAFLWEKLNDNDVRVRIFTGIIMRPIIDDYDLTDLWHYWENCEDPIEKDYFIYDLADIKNLNENHHRVLYEYIKSNLDFFVKSKRDYLSPEIAFSDLQLKMKKKVIHKPTGKVIHPITKKWIYWLNILSYLDVISADDLLNFLGDIDITEVGSISEDFYKDVRNYLYERLGLN